MHEMSLIERILSIAEESLAGRRVARVNELTVEAGLLANVVPEALSFAFEAVSGRSVCRGAKLNLIRRPAAARCRLCREEFQSEVMPIVCPFCSGREIEITGGTEVFLSSIDFDEEEE
ncbi:MAG: hydrogenase maturation nickel metallochaperone HypA [Clostridiales bacterium]|nr:hydrogenase maturation nickel metallochaperone HypA [Clostridiales bacterium]